MPESMVIIYREKLPANLRCQHIAWFHGGSNKLRADNLGISLSPKSGFASQFYAEPYHIFQTYLHMALQPLCDLIC